MAAKYIIVNAGSGEVYKTDSDDIAMSLSHSDEHFVIHVADENVIYNEIPEHIEDYNAQNS